MCAWRSNEKPSFFKVLSKMDFTELLRLPPALFTRYDLTLPENVKIRGHDGRTWNVTAERFHGGVFCFTQGWPAFAEDAALKLGEFLVFTPLTKSKLDVAIYDTSFCEREIPPPPPPPPSPPSPPPPPARIRRRKINRSSQDSSSSNPLYFEFRLKKHQGSRITLPVKFCKTGGMMGKKYVMLEYVATRMCKAVAVDHRRKSPAARFDLTRGWRDFREESGLVWGETYSFELNPNHNLIYVNQVV